MRQRDFEALCCLLNGLLSIAASTPRLLFVIVIDGAPDSDVSHPLWHLGPWQGHREGDVSRLRPHYRQLLLEQRFVVLRPKTLGAFEPEVAAAR